MRILAIDYGQNKTGIAITDPLGYTAQGLRTIKHNGKDKELLSQLKQIIQEYEVEIIVLGMPINLDGTKSTRVDETERFFHKLKCGFPKIKVDTCDERLTTKQAQNTLIDMGIKAKKKKEIEDTLAATYILEVYMKKISN